MPAEGFRVAKSNGTFMTLSRMTAIDLIVQRCLLEALQEESESLFSDSSYAYRKGRGMNSALQKYCEYGSAFRMAAKIDPVQCFDSMDYTVLQNALDNFFSDPVLVRLLMKFAQVPVLADGESQPRTRGIPQGSPLAPLLCNIYFHSLDRILEEQGISFIRFADDIAVFANGTTDLTAHVQFIRDYLEKELNLAVNERKYEQGAPFRIRYLGHRFLVGKDGILTVGEGESVTAAYHAWHSRSLKNIGQTVHILSDGILRQKDHSLLLDSETGQYTIPSKNTECINIFSNVIFDSGFLAAASRNGIPVNVFDQHGHMIGSYLPFAPLHSPRTTIEQLSAYYDQNHRMMLARAFVLGSIHNLRLNIRYYNKNRPAPLYAKALKEIKKLELKIKVCTDYSELLLLEAQVRSEYYGCFDSFILDERFPFDHRTRRPPQNAFNAMLSFGNTILYSYIATEINKTSLDIRVGFLHATNTRKESLNLDIAELFKPLIVDRTVLSLINRKQLDFREHFVVLEGGGVYLSAEGKRLFLQALDDKLHIRITERGRSMNYREVITEETRKLIRHFRSGEKYVPFKQVR